MVQIRKGRFRLHFIPSIVRRSLESEFAQRNFPGETPFGSNGRSVVDEHVEDNRAGHEHDAAQEVNVGKVEKGKQDANGEVDGEEAIEVFVVSSSSKQ
jgi:hypothetical protein